MFDLLRVMGVLELIPGKLGIYPEYVSLSQSQYTDIHNHSHRSMSNLESYLSTIGGNRLNMEKTCKLSVLLHVSVFLGNYMSERFVFGMCARKKFCRECNQWINYIHIFELIKCYIH